MFANAIAAERFRLLRDRGTLFWGFCFAPLVGFFLSVAGEVFLRNLAKKPLTGMPLDLVGQVMKALGDGASLFPALFLAIGAAAILAGDYRWETWRLLTPRNSRLHLLGAKLVVVGEAILWNLVLTIVLSLLASVIGASISGRSLTASASGAGLAQIAGVLAITWLEAMTLVSLAAVIAVVARSPMGAVVAVVVVRFAQSILAVGLQGLDPEPNWKTLAIPGYSADLLRGFVSAPNHAGLETGPVGVALIVLLAWTAVLATGAILLFQRQDLTRE